MITINKNRTAYIPETDRHIGFENDNLVETRYFNIVDEDISSFNFKLDLFNTKDIVDLEKLSLDEGKCVLTWKITSSVIGEGGNIPAQLRAFDETGEKVWHSQIMEFIANESVNGEKEINDERVISEFEQLETRVTNAVNTAEEFSSTAQTSSEAAEIAEENAKIYATEAKEHRDTTEIYMSKALQAESKISTDIENFEEIYGSADEFAQNTIKHFDNKNNPHSVTASQIGAAENNHTHADYVTEKDFSNHTEDKNNPHGITPQKIGVYNKEEVDNIISPILEPIDFIWTEREYFADGENGFIAKVYDNSVVIDNAIGNEYVQLVCRDEIMGFSFSIAGYSDAILRINGEVRHYTNPTKDGSIFASDVVPLSWMKSDIFLVGNDNTWYFSDMKLGKMPYVDSKIGDISTALDNIISLQEEITG